MANQSPDNFDLHTDLFSVQLTLWFLSYQHWIQSLPKNRP
jgi:hypothetical protein